MAASATLYTAAPRPYNIFGREIKATVAITLTGSYPGSGGDTLDVSHLDGVPGGMKPYKWELWDAATGIVYGYFYKPGTTAANGKVTITTLADGAELATTTYPSGLTDGTVILVGTFYFRQPA